MKVWAILLVVFVLILVEAKPNNRQVPPPPPPTTTKAPITTTTAKAAAATTTKAAAATTTKAAAATTTKVTAATTTKVAAATSTAAVTTKAATTAAATTKAAAATTTAAAVTTTAAVTTKATTATTASATSNTFTTEQQTYVNKAISNALSGTCSTTSTATCTCTGVTMASSFYYAPILNTTSRLLISNGVPNHVYNTGQTKPNPNSVCPHWTFAVVPVSPTKISTFKSNSMGPVGVAISGAYFYNHLSSPTTNAVYNEGVSFDTCNGHADNSCSYHYHKNPVCINSGANCTLTGYMLDGFPVYSYCPNPKSPSVALKSCYKLNSGATGSAPTDYTYDSAGYSAGTCDLDMANGYTFTDGKGYAYVFTTDFPYIMPGNYATVKQLCYM